ncbi:hypothetical protein CKQ70_31160 [Bacillus toyonensis]|nr:hypothetical protein CKQ70_31160 [Bacillus toyonensis]
MKEQRKKNERRTTKTNDNSKISEVNGSNEPCRGLATPIIFYTDIRGYIGGGTMDICQLPISLYTPQF